MQEKWLEVRKNMLNISYSKIPQYRLAYDDQKYYLIDSDSDFFQNILFSLKNFRKMFMKLIKQCIINY